MDKTCLECGNVIPWRAGIKAREQAKFCGNPCKFAWQKRDPPHPRAPRETRPCATCGEPVSYLPSQRGTDREGRSAAVYCSRKCFGIGHSKTMTGRRPSNGVYASHHVFRQMMRAQYFHDRCAICGWAEAPCDVCHILPRRSDPSRDDPQNITMLCPNHHRMFDRGLIPIDEVRATRANVLR